MKILMILGGLLGFLIGAGFGLAQTSAWPDALWRASVTAFAGGLLLRWWGRMWIRCFVQAQEEKFAAASVEATTTSTKGK
jgi:hypothetical protein